MIQPRSAARISSAVARMRARIVPPAWASSPAARASVSSTRTPAVSQGSSPAVTASSATWLATSAAKRDRPSRAAARREARASRRPRRRSGQGARRRMSGGIVRGRECRSPRAAAVCPTVTSASGRNPRPRLPRPSPAVRVEMIAARRLACGGGVIEREDRRRGCETPGPASILRRVGRGDGPGAARRARCSRERAFRRPCRAACRLSRARRQSGWWPSIASIAIEIEILGEARRQRRRPHQHPFCHGHAGALTSSTASTPSPDSSSP